jgi:hypothetical protein
MSTLQPGDLAVSEWTSISLLSEEHGEAFLGTVRQGECFIIASERTPFNKVKIIHSKHGAGWVNCTWVRKVQNGG